ncbi:hypothetical protein BS049_RS23320 [Vibrio parahaemolyticus]|nr:hypothetical protein [Vibrio parahaemolyticus]
MNNNAKLASTVLLTLLCGTAQSAPILYTDYLDALNAPISTDVQQYARQGMPAERVMNVIFHQSQTVDVESAPVLLDNVAMLMAQPDYRSYLSALQQVRIQALFVSGQLKQGIMEIEALSAKEQAPYCLLWSAGYLQLGALSQSLHVFNSMTPEVYEQNPQRSLHLAQDMVVNYGVSSDDIHLPGDGDAELAKRLAGFYDESGVFDRAYAQRKRALDWVALAPEQQSQRLALTVYASEHDLVAEEVGMMESYLLSAERNGIVIGDIETIMAYTDKLVTYYADKRNKHHREPVQIEPLLGALRLAGENSKASEQAYLTHRIFIYQQTRPDFYYTDVVALTQLTQQASLIGDTYQKTLPKTTRQTLLEGYFSLSSTDKNELFMAKEYVPFVSQCDDSTPTLIRALKGHEFAQVPDIERAQACYDGVDLAVLSLPEAFSNGLQQEQERVAYATLKSSGNETQALAMAKRSGDVDVRLDAALFALENEPLTSERVASLLALQDSLMLTPEQNVQFEDALVASLTSNDDAELLMTVLKRTPERHALALAFLSMEQDATTSSVDYLLMRLAQPEALTAQEEIKTVRYLDGVYDSLSEPVQQRIAGLSLPSVQTMLQYRQLDAQLAQAFPETKAPITEAVPAALNEYQRLKATLSPIPAEPNYTAQLWLLSELDRQFAHHLQVLSERVDDNVAQVLNTQVAQLTQQSEQSLRQLLDLKIEGVADTRVLAAVMRQQEEKENDE